MGHVTNNLKPHLLTKVGVGKEGICSAASAWSSAIWKLTTSICTQYHSQHPPLNQFQSPGSQGARWFSNRFWWSLNNSVPGLSDESRCTVSAGKGGRALQRGLRAFKKSFQSAERLRRSRTGPGISLGARSRATKPADGYPEAGLKLGALGRVCAARLRRTCVRMCRGHRESSRSLGGARWWSSLALFTWGTCGRPRPAPQPHGSPAPMCEVSPGSCRPLPVLLSGKRTWEWGLRRCRGGCPLLGLSLCRRATSSCGTSSSRIVILVSDKTKALGAVLWRGVSGLSRGGWRAGGGARVWRWAGCARGLD